MTHETWNVCRHGTPDYAPQFGIYTGSETRDFATVSGDDAERQANLCAAAPDLLAALGSLMVVFDRLVPVANKYACYRAAMEAIAKAEGNK